MAEPWENDPIVGRRPAQGGQTEQPWLNDPVVNPRANRAPPSPTSPALPSQEAPHYRDPKTGELIINITKQPPLPAPGAPTPTTPQVHPLGVDAYAEQQRLIRQGVNPHALSPYFPETPAMKPQLLGYVEEYDSGSYYRMQDPHTGKDVLYAINPKTDFVARHPDNNRLAVYTKTDQAKENPLVGASRLIAPNIMGPVTMSTPGSTERMLAAREAARQAAQNAPHSSAMPPAGVPPPMLPGMPESNMAQIQTQRAEDMARDIAAFDEMGVRKGPFFNGQAGSAVGQMVKGIPGVGAPMNRAVDQAVHGAAQAVRDTSEALGSGNVEHAGQTLQRGLDRFRNDGIADLPPGDLTRLGIQPRAPGEYVGEVTQLQQGARPQGITGNPYTDRNGQTVWQVARNPTTGALEWVNPAEHVIISDGGRLAAYRNSERYRPLRSEGQVEREAEAAPIIENLLGGTARTNRGVEVPAARPQDQVIMGRRGAADLSDAELAALTNRATRGPTNMLSFAARAEALYEKAQRAIPRMLRRDGSNNPLQIPMPNTRAALNAINADIRHQIAGQATIDGELARRIMDPQAGNFLFDQIRAIRTEVGRALGNTNPLQQTLNRTQLKQLYAAITRDMEMGLQDLRDRAYIRASPFNHNSADYVPPAVARQADQALRDFKVADRYFRQGQYNMDQFNKLLGVDNPQAAAGILIRSAVEGTKGNMRMLRQALAALRPEERQEIASAVLLEMGRPTGSAAGVVKEAGFSPGKFMTAWDNMAPEARVLLFGNEYATAMNGLSREIHNIARIAGRMRGFEKEMNTSRSGTHIINAALAMLTGAAVYSGHALAAGLAIAPLAGISVLLSRPSYVNWLARYVRLRAHMERAGPERFMPRMAVLYSQLHRATLQDPQLAPVLRALAEEHGIGQGRQDNQQEEQRQRVQ